jgi:hypothetical protein
VTIHDPKEGQEYSFNLLVRGSAADEESRLRFVLVRIDSGEWLPARSKDGWLYEWVFDIDTWELENGPHRLSAICADDVQFSEIEEVAFFVNNDWNHPYGRPNIRVLSPINGSRVSGLVTIEGTADDDGLVQQIHLVVGSGGPVEADGTSEWTLQLDTLAYPNGLIELKIWAFDGNLASDVIRWNLDIFNDQPPQCTIIWPISNQTFVEDTEIHGTAFDPEDGVLSVEVQIDEEDWITPEGGSNWSYFWRIGDMEEGDHSIRARAFDGSQYSDVQLVEVRVLHPTSPPLQPEDPRDTLWVLAIIGFLVVFVIFLFFYIINARAK